MGMSFIGSYSGIDQAAIDQLMEAERIPLNQLTRKKENIVEKQNAWKDINTRLNSLFEKMKALKNVGSFNSKIATSSDDKHVSMDVGASAAEGKYSIKVDKLASNSSLVGGRLETVYDEEGKKIENPVISKDGGTFSIINGDGDSVDIKIDAGSSLRDIVSKINAKTKDSKDENGEIEKGSGISATIIDNRIVLNDEKTGARSITVEPIGTFDLNDIGLELNKMVDIETGNIVEGKGKAILRTGNQAEFTLNGIKITSDSNTVSDVIDGVTINLSKVHDTGQSDMITVSADTEKATQAIQNFIDQYNSTMDFIEEKTKAGDPEVPGSKGILAGEGSLVRLQASLRKMVTGKHTVEASEITDISKLGVTTVDRSGRLSFDKEKFLEALKEDKENVVNFFNSAGVDEDGKVQSTKNTGLVDKVNNLIDGFISKKDGIIKSQNEGFERSLKDLATRIENFEARMVKKEAYYIRTFTALDIAMMKAEDQMGWLQGQVDAMNGGR